ncbi:MAG: hypothetical protein VKO64_03080 [Candidatus Sericytochromatia bacterium]|nr:hypothetical protein [Candidatus Sericytochromatia bacterium]
MAQVTPTPTLTLGTPSIVASFDASQRQFAEGLALDKSGAYAYTATLAGEIFRVNLQDGKKLRVATLENFPQDTEEGQLFVAGVAFDADENLDIAVAYFAEDGKYESGIYRMAKGGSVASLRTRVLGFPNGIAYAPDGTCFVSNSFGQILTVSASGEASEWFKEAGVTNGDEDSACATGLVIGANGIHVTGDAVYFTNSDRAQLVKVVRKSDGTAGERSFVVSSNCATFNGADGLVLGPDGNFYVASNNQNALLKVTPAGAVSVVASSSVFAFPTSLVYSAKDSAIYLSNFAYGGDVNKPGIVKVPVQRN